MKKLITTLTLLLMFSSPSYAEWEIVAKDMDGNTFYVDFDRIRKVDGFVYFWELVDFVKPTQYGEFSFREYLQGDCKLFRFKVLTEVYYKQSMGRGTSSEHTQKNPKWHYPRPVSVVESILKKVCSR